MLMVRFISIWWCLLVTTRGFTIAIGLICIKSWIIPIRNWRRLLPKRLINPLRLLPSLIVPPLMHILIEGSIPYNIIVSTLRAKVMRMNNKKTK
ncbi:hypothetical protein AHAS_Ahas20G0199000 [Arachis hypogaea]